MLVAPCSAVVPVHADTHAVCSAVVFDKLIEENVPHGNVTSAGWQVTLCDPMWRVSSHSGVAILRTATHLLLTYLHVRVR